jgi:hypothetical protein
MKHLFLILFIFFGLQVNSQGLHSEPTLDKKKRNILLISEASIYTIALVGLNQLWYADYPRQSFRFKNDNSNWLQMDKMGHTAVSYYSGVAGIKAYQWAGFSRKKAIWYGGMTGSFFLTIIEVLDGFSYGWGASSGDLIANTTGSLFAIGQALKWNEQRIQLKYSYKPSEWADMNPEKLGNNHLERALKDYNGQTYWLSFNMKSLFQIDNESFPNWLSLSLGHSGNGMISALQKENQPQRKRQFFLSLDIDLNKIKTKNKTLNSVLHTFGFLKFPAPTVELKKGKLYFHPIYY